MLLKTTAKILELNFKSMASNIDDVIIEKIINSIENKQNVLIHGFGGVGKTYMLMKLSKILAMSYKVFNTATTGIAAVNLTIPGEMIGMTLHKWAGIGRGDQPLQKMTAEILNNNGKLKRWMNTRILFIDEISMLGAALFDTLNVIGQTVRQNFDLPFGGIQLIMIGDFLQLPPVKDKFIFESETWKTMTSTEVGNPGGLNIFFLEEPKRFTDLFYHERLIRIREGTPSSEDMAFLEQRRLKYLQYLKKLPKMDPLAIKPTVLFSKKIDVEAHNNNELDKLPSQSKEFVAEDHFTPYNNRARYDDYIKPLDDAIPKAILLKVGAQVMLRANLDVPNGLANGSRGVVTEIHEDSVNVKWMNTRVTIVGDYVWEREDKEGKATRKQIPLTLAWSNTIHKSQGLTLDYAIVDLGPSVFADGQAYVALSRLRSGESLLISDIYSKAIKANKKAIDEIEALKKIATYYEKIELVIKTKIVFID